MGQTTKFLDEKYWSDLKTKSALAGITLDDSISPEDFEIREFLRGRTHFGGPDTVLREFSSEHELSSADQISKSSFVWFTT